MKMYWCLGAIITSVAAVASFSAPVLGDEKSPFANKYGSSLKASPKQVIRLLSISEMKRSGEWLWVAGKGYAMINGGSGAWFWSSSTPPQVELELPIQSQVAENCRSLIEDGLPEGTYIELEGLGDFKGTERPNGFLGAFTMKSITRCQSSAPATKANHFNDWTD